jgi:putative transposase
LKQNTEIRAKSRPALVKPELVATAPNQLWSWDIPKLAGRYKWTWYQLYTIFDVYSRYVVGWLVAPRESAILAEQLIADAIHRHHVADGQLTLHADRGSSMTSRTVSQLLADLGVLQSHSRPHQSNDNPYSESQFTTLKYSPTFPGHFADIASARAFCGGFFEHYNNEHRHSGIGLHTPRSERPQYRRSSGSRPRRWWHRNRRCR